MDAVITSATTSNSPPLPTPTPESDKPATKKEMAIVTVMTVVVIGLVVLLVVVLFVKGSLLKPGSVTTRTISNTSATPTWSTRSLVSPTNATALSPVGFATKFLSGDYRVDTTGNVEVTEEVDENGVTGTVKTTLKLDGAVFYSQKGVSVRGELMVGDIGKQVVIKKDNKVIVLNEKDKTYDELLKSDEMGQFFLNVFESSFPLIQLVNDTSTKKILWTNAGSNEWTTNWQYNFSLEYPPKKLTALNLKATINPVSGLLTILKMRLQNDVKWQEIAFKYTEQTIYPELLFAPPGYKITLRPTSSL